MKSNKSAPVPISDVIKSVFTKIEGEKTVSKEFIETSWRQAAGEAGFKHSTPVELKNGLLLVRVDSSAWMQELALEKRKILKALQRALGKDRITGINFKIGEF
jgi:predicted nucleic acid-binding Zn ribbon protein